MLSRTARQVASTLVKVNPATAFLIIALLFGFIFTFLTPPFGVADEPNHFYRAYQVSEGVFRPVAMPNHQYGGNLPENLPVLTNQLGGHFVNGVRTKITFKQLWAAKNLRIDTSKTTLVAFTNTAVYEPVNYLPQAIGIMLARLLPGHPDFLLTFYLARLVNLLIGVTLIYYAIKKLPFAKWGAVMLFLTPMALFQLGSQSTDALTYGLVAFGFSYGLSCLYPARKLTRKDQIGLGAVVLAMALLRFPYACVAIVPFGVLLKSLKSVITVKKMLVIAGAIAIAVVFLFLYWQSYFGSNIHLTTDPTVDPHHQLHNLFDLPWMLSVFVRTHLSGYHDIVTNGVVGVLGWLDVPLPQWTITGYSFFLIASFFITTPGEKHMITRHMRWLFLALFVFLFLALDGIEYVYGTPLRLPEIMSLQGRYYISLLLPLLIATQGTIKLSDKDWQKFHLSRLAFIGLSEITAVIIVLNSSWLNVK